MTERDSGAAPLEDTPSEVEEFLRDAVEMDDIDNPNLGDVEAEPGEVVAVVDGVEIRHLADESDHVLPVEDESGRLIGGDDFPEVGGGFSDTEPSAGRGED